MATSGDLIWPPVRTFSWPRTRFECPNCGERHTEDHPEIEGKVTRRLARQLVRDSKYLTIRELSRRHRQLALRHGPGAGLGHPRRPTPPRSIPCRVLLVDETSLRRRHRYVTVLLKGESGEVLGMVERSTRFTILVHFVGTHDAEQLRDP